MAHTEHAMAAYPAPPPPPPQQVAPVQRDARQVCPCISTTAMHIGGCGFAATMAGAILGGMWGAIAGGALGIAIGCLAVSQLKNE